MEYLMMLNEISRQLSMTTNMATISVQVAQDIASCERPMGLDLLQHALGWSPFDEADHPRKGIILDFHYDNLMYCVQKGFPWQQICTLVNMAANIAELSKGKSLAEEVQIYHKECQSCGQISEQNMKHFTEYFFRTFMKHYQLYQYVFNVEQDRMIIKVHTEVDTPVEPLPFTESKQWKVWDYEQKVKEVEMEGEKKKEEREAAKIQTKLEQDEKLHRAVENLQNTDHPLEREQIVSMINEIASHHLTAAGYSIKSQIDDTISDLEFMLKKTSIPRPQELDILLHATMELDPEEEEEECSTLAPLPRFGDSPPPRHKTKTPLSGSKRPKSVLKDKAANKSRSSSRASLKGKAK